MTSVSTSYCTSLRACARVRRLAAFWVAAGLAGVSASAFAQYDATAYIPNGTVFGHTTTPGDNTYAYNVGTNSAVVTFTASPVPSVSYTTTVFNPSGQTILSGGGNMTYRFTIAAQPFTHVPIDFSGLYSSSTFPSGPGYGATTAFSIQTVNSSVSTYSSFQSNLQGDCRAPICLQYTTFNASYTSMQSDVAHVNGTFEGTLDMLTGANGTVIGSVQLFAGAGLNVAFVPASASAFIDPHLEIDAAFLAANPGATLTITAGVGNDITSVSAVPEPETYALMLAGLALVTFRARRAVSGAERA